jgi:hypothetical protein
MNPEVYLCFNKSPPLVHFLSQMNPIYTTPSYLSKINFILSSDLRLGLRNGLFPSGDRAPGTHWIGVWVDLRGGLEKRKFLTLPGPELRPLCRPARS